jgi:hypothetical protein
MYRQWKTHANIARSSLYEHLMASILRTLLIILAFIGLLGI